MKARQKKRVLLICAVDFTVRQFLLPLARALEKEGYEVTLACGRGPYFDTIAKMGFRIEENPISRSMNVLAHLCEIWRTYRFIRRNQFDIVHVHTPIAALVGRIAARLAGVPVIIYTAHGFYFHEGMSPAKRQFHIWLERIGAKFGDFIMTVSREDEETALASGIARRGTIETIYNGVDTAAFDPAQFAAARVEVREKYGIPADAPVVGFVGRLVREKGIFELVEAVARVRMRNPKVRLLIVGDVLKSDYDAGKNELLTKIAELGLTDVVAMTGMVEDTRPVLAAMDLFCLPSYREGMPVSLLEAMAMAKPCIASNIRGCREEIEDGVSGWLVPVRDVERLAERIEWCVEHSNEAAAVGNRARQRVQKLFELDRVLAHQVAIYRRLTTPHCSSPEAQKTPSGG